MLHPPHSPVATSLALFRAYTYKQNLVFCLIHRVFNLSSSYENFHTQLEVVRKVFNLNGFPSHMFDHIVRFLDHTFDPNPRVLTVHKKIIYFYLPCIHMRGYILCKHAYKSADSVPPPFLIWTLDSLFVLQDESSSFLPFRDKVPKYLRSSVVHLFKCRCCSASVTSSAR